MELETERLRLRDFLREDWQDVLAYHRDPLYQRFYDPSEWEDNEQGARRFVGQFLDQQRECPRTRFQLAVVLQATGELIGSCGIRVNDPLLGEANIGYEIDPRHWRRGYATEAAHEIVRFGFQTLGLHRIWSWCVAENVASARVMEKIGMRYEGREREKVRIRERWHDTLRYAILDHEWSALARAVDVTSP